MSSWEVERKVRLQAGWGKHGGPVHLPALLHVNCGLGASSFTSLSLCGLICRVSI